MSIRTMMFFALIALSSAASAQDDPRYGGGGYQGGEAVECRSNNYSFRRCPVPWRDARLVRQLSDTQCVRGMNWGIDRNGIWVDRGCAGEFVARGRHEEYAGGGWRPPSGWDQRFAI